MRLTIAGSLQSLITSPARAPLRKRWPRTTLDCRWNRLRPAALSRAVSFTVRQKARPANQDFHFFRPSKIPVRPADNIRSVCGSGVGTGGTIGVIGATGVPGVDGVPPIGVVGGPTIPPPGDPEPDEITEPGGGVKRSSLGAKGAGAKAGAPARAWASSGGAVSNSGSAAITGPAGASARRFPHRVLAMCSPSVITVSPLRNMNRFFDQKTLLPRR